MGHPVHSLRWTATLVSLQFRSDDSNRFIVVHNGIITNYNDIKVRVIGKPAASLLKIDFVIL